jgi:CheY-like chemotaxis protein
MDITMPRMNGVEATRKIREFSTLPILFLTARSLESDKEAA